MSFEDAVADRNLYETWLLDMSGCDCAALEMRFLRILADVGLALPNGLALRVAADSDVWLAEFIAHNTPFETDDEQWAKHCREEYDDYGDASETAAERNGARVSFPGGR